MTTDPTTTPAPEPIKATASDRRNAALAAFAAFGDPTTVAVALAAAPNGRELLDIAYNAAVTDLAINHAADPDFGDRLAELATYRGAVSAILETLAPAGKSARPVDPVAARAAMVARLGELTAVRHALLSMIDRTGLAIEALDVANDLTMDEQSIVDLAVTPPAVLKMNDKIRAILDGKAVRSPAAKGVPRAAVATGPLAPIGTRFQRTGGASEGWTCTVVALGDGIGYAVTDANGDDAGTYGSPTAAAAAAPKGAGVNGRAFWSGASSKVIPG